MRSLALILAAAVTTMVVGQPSSTAGSAGAHPVVTVTADVIRLGAKDAAPLAPGQTIAEGDQVALDVDLDHEAYVYVLYVDANGTVINLYPQAGHARVPSGGKHLPALRRRWKIDNLRGEECFVVLASSTRLNDNSRKHRAYKQCRGAKPAMTKVRIRPWVGPDASTCPEPSDDPETTKVMACSYTRGPTEVAEGIVAPPDATGVATAVFWMDHLARL